MVAENFPKVMTYAKSPIQEVQRKASRIKYKIFYTHIIFKLQKSTEEFLLNRERKNFPKEDQE